MSGTLPPEIEICVRPRENGRLCGHPLYRPQPDASPYCYACGGTERGALYVRKLCDCNPGFHDGDPA